MIHNDVLKVTVMQCDRVLRQLFSCPASQCLGAPEAVIILKYLKLERFSRTLLFLSSQFY